MAHPTLAIELTPTERGLILRYGYPFDQIKAALLAASLSTQIEGLTRRVGSGPTDRRSLAFDQSRGRRARRTIAAE